MLVNVPSVVRRPTAMLMIASTCLFAATALAQTATPSITSLAPNSGPVGTQVTITGAGFSPTGNAVHFGDGGRIDLPSTNRGTIIVYTVPAATGPCEPPKMCAVASQPVVPGTYRISVSSAEGRSSNVVSFTATR